MLTLLFLVLGGLLSAPFVIAIFRAASGGRVVRIWLAEVAASLCLWVGLALVFRSGLIVEQAARIAAALLINLVWVALVLAVSLGAVAAIVRVAQLRARLRASGK